MTLQKELEQILLDDAKIDSKLEELARLKALTTKVTAAMDGEVVSRSRNTDTMAEAVIKIVEMQDEINSLVDSYVDRKAFYAQAIDSLPKPVYIRVLYGYYYHGKSFQQIADEIGYTRRNVCYIHGDALQALENVLNRAK